MLDGLRIKQGDFREMQVLMNRHWQMLAAVSFALVAMVTSSSGQQSDAEASESSEAAVLDEEGKLVRFERDIVPILRSRCLECHGPEDAKADLRVDEVDSLMQYIEPGDLESSMMYTDFLVTDDQEMLMPPVSQGGPLSAGELALIRVWIEEGAAWPEGYQFPAGDDPQAAAEPATPNQAPQTLAERVWAFQGFFHPATVHFPIALFYSKAFPFEIGQC
ncbi:MAG: hypothetical protein MI861_15160, partial [Pirellulales bacterium]|nr:hypothetical protein [Pirellulales bacterium]